MSLQNVSLYEGMVCLWDRKRNGSTITGKYSCRKILQGGGGPAFFRGVQLFPGGGGGGSRCLFP